MNEKKKVCDDINECSGNLLLTSNCKLINSCLSASPCDRNAKCLNTDGSFTCKCKQDFAGDGFKCKSTLVDEEGFRIPFF